MAEESVMEEAIQAIEAGRYQEANSICRRVLEGNPTDRGASILLGRIACQEGRYAEAITILDPVARSQPPSIEALRWLSVAFRESGSLKASAGVAMHALQLRPDDASVLVELGLSQTKLLMLDEARSSFEKALSLSGSATTATHLGGVLYKLGCHQEAADAYQQAIDADGSCAAAYVGLARTHLALDQAEAARQEAAKALEIDSELGSAQLVLAQVLIRQGRASEARARAEQAVSIDPNDAVAQAVLGQALQSLGLSQEAEAAFRRSLEADPHQSYSYLGLIYGRKVRESDREFEAPMLALTRDATLPQSDHQYLHYALGRLYEGLGAFETSIRHYDQANRIARFIKFRGQPFDRDRYAAFRDQVIGFFTKERFRQPEGMGTQEETPVFVVGMMRSGTTLMEQILSRHPEVAAAGEQAFWLQNGFDSFDPETKTLGRGQLQRLIEDYLELLRPYGPGAKRITDKMPANDLVLGFIHAAFPNARIIHMRRNAPDTCLSVYATPNEAVFDFAHDKEAIAFAYREHERLMDHWRGVLPPDRLMDVVYEDLVGDPEPIARRVVEFCGLEWDEHCLNPERSSASVVTPSAWQVRQPIYKSSVQRWKNFEPWIPEFAALAD